MSRLNTDYIISPITGSPILKNVGNIVQMTRVRYDPRTTISANNSGNGTEISALRMTMTPRHSGNLLLCQWVVAGEMHNDCVFTIFKNGGLITTGGEQGYNAETGNARWSGFITSTYDVDNSSTPHHWFIQYFCNAENTSSRNYAPAVRSSNGNNRTLYLNRTQGSNGQNGHEVQVSTGVMYEITR